MPNTVSRLAIINIYRHRHAVAKTNGHTLFRLAWCIILSSKGVMDNDKEINYKSNRCTRSNPFIDNFLCHLISCDF